MKKRNTCNFDVRFQKKKVYDVAVAASMHMKNPLEALKGSKRNPWGKGIYKYRVMRVQWLWIRLTYQRFGGGGSPNTCKAR